MLFYTDGLIEARNPQGAFFPLAESATTLGAGSLDDALDGLLDDLVRHAADEMDDDMALVLAERQPGRSEERAQRLDRLGRNLGGDPLTDRPERPVRRRPGPAWPSPCPSGVRRR